MDIDHVFILCDEGAPEAEALLRAGLQEGPPNTHAGQGTACRRFLVGNIYLELLWVCDEREARSEAIARTELWDRWHGRRTGGCPFGIVLRPSIDEPAEARPAFDTWAYPPAYLPPGVAIDIATGTSLEEPFVAFLGFQRERPRGGAEPIGGIAVGHLTSACLDGPLPDPGSPALDTLCAEHLLDIEPADDWRMTLVFDRGASSQEFDCGPTLPLTLCW